MKWFVYVVIGLAMGWYGAPYLLEAATFLFFWTLIYPLEWAAKGGFRELASSIAATCQWLWGFELIRASVYVSAGMKIALLVYVVQKHRRYVKGLEWRIKDLSADMEKLRGKCRMLSNESCDLIAGLEAIRRRTLASRDRIHSKVAEIMRTEVEEILVRHPFERYEYEAEASRERWDIIFEAKEEAILKTRRGPHPITHH